MIQAVTVTSPIALPVALYSLHLKFDRLFLYWFYTLVHIVKPMAVRPIMPGL